MIVKELSAPLVNMKEILRYAGSKEIEETVLDCLSEASESLSYKVCYEIVRVSVNDDTVDMDFVSVHSGDLAKNLRGCDKAVVFAATVGTGIDRLIAKYNRISPARALCLQAIGSERVESLCDAFEDEIKKEISGGEVFSDPVLARVMEICLLRYKKRYFICSIAQEK